MSGAPQWLTETCYLCYGNGCLLGFVRIRKCVSSLIRTFLLLPELLYCDSHGHDHLKGGCGSNACEHSNCSHILLPRVYVAQGCTNLRISSQLPFFSHGFQIYLSTLHIINQHNLICFPYLESGTLLSVAQFPAEPQPILRTVVCC